MVSALYGLLSNGHVSCWSLEARRGESAGAGAGAGVTLPSSPAWASLFKTTLVAEIATKKHLLVSCVTPTPVPHVHLTDRVSSAFPHSITSFYESMNGMLAGQLWASTV